ncbi:MAG: YrzE family protein [Clostridia bacterium]|nr:YrzE family protein [Clostridia bacterium]
MTRKMKNNPASKPDFGFTVAGLIGGGVGLTVTLILVLIAPFLLLNTNDPNSVSNYCAAVCAFIGSGVGSAIASLLCKESPLQAGLLSGATEVVPIILVSLFLPGSINFVNCAIILSSIGLGAFSVSFLIMRTKSNQKKNMKRVMKRR